MYIKTTDKEKEYYNVLPNNPVPVGKNDIYLISNKQTRLDLLAYKYYNNRNLWRYLSDVNNNITKGSVYVKEGIQIRIPIN